MEAALVAVAGLGLALAANQLSPRGLVLSRDYFPGALRPPAPPVGTNAGSGSAAEALAARLRQRGLQMVDSNEVRQLFHDPRAVQGAVVFVDARDDALYQAGHVPGAWQFDHYRPEHYLPAVLPACLAAEQVVVYCQGGECEDSEFAAVALGDAGVPRQRLFIYGGGFTEWVTNGLPVEVGPRNSGQMRPSRP